MKGLIITGGDGPSAERCRVLAKDAAIIVAADSGLYAAHAAGLTPDWIVGDMDSFTDSAALDAYPVEKILRYPTDKDLTDTELACQLLFEKNCTDITLIGGGGGRLAHIAAHLALFERSACPSRWHTAHEDILLVKAGQADIMLNVTAGTVISVFPAGAGPWRVQSINLKWPLDNVIWKRGHFGISNTALDTAVTLHPLSGSFLVIIEII